jgi:K+-sensing histidine kinase KdpD
VAAWVLALAGPALVTLALIPFRSSLSVGGFLFCMLLVVIAVAVIAGAQPALTAVAAGAVAGAFIYESPTADLAADLVSLVVFVIVGAAVGILIGQLAQLVEEQASSRRVEAALRRVATLVAGAAPPDELFAAVAEKAGRLLGADFAHMAHYESDDSVTFVGTWSRTGDHFPVGSQWSLAGENLSAAVLRTGRPARIDGFADAPGPLAG